MIKLNNIYNRLKKTIYEFMINYLSEQELKEI